MPLNLAVSMCQNLPSAFGHLSEGSVCIQIVQVIAQVQVYLVLIGSFYIYKIEMQMENMNIRLSNDTKMPIVGLGTWKIPKQNCEQIVYQALGAGYRLLDCACDYGNQKQVGLGIQKAVSEKVVTREDIFITSKLWNTFHRPEHVEEACRRTLSDLGVEYLDLYLMHFPISLKYVDPAVRYPPEWIHDPTASKPVMVQDHVPLIQTWVAMEALVKKGLVKNIGVSNFGAALLRDLLNSCTIRPAVLQIQLHPQLTQKNLLIFARQQKIAVTAYSSFGASSYVQLGGAKAEQSLLEHQVIKTIAENQKKSTAQILLKWAVSQGIAVIPKTLKKDRLKQNSNLFNWQLSEAEIASIDSLNLNKRYNDPGVYCEKYFGLFFPIFE